MRIYHRNKGIPLKKIKNLSNVQMPTRVKLNLKKRHPENIENRPKPLGPATA